MQATPQDSPEVDPKQTNLDELAIEIESAKAVEKAAKRLPNYNRPLNRIMFEYLLGWFCTLFNLAPPPQFMAARYDNWIEGVSV